MNRTSGFHKVWFFLTMMFCGPAGWLHLAAQTPLAAEVKEFQGKPSMFINGEAVYPALYSLTDVPGGRWSWEELPAHTMRQFCNRGFRLVQVDIAFDHVWLPDGGLSLDTTLMQLRGVRRNCPGAAIFIRFHVNPPKWWQQRYPEENTVYADTLPMPDVAWGLQRIIEDDEQNPTRHSLASARWKKELGTQFSAYLRLLSQTEEAASIAGFQIAGGVYGEWHYWGFIENEPDMSAPMQQYFRQWLRTRYGTEKILQLAWGRPDIGFETVQIPGLAERRNSRRGIFRDPAIERPVIDYFEAQHDAVADAMIHFCKIAKENWPRPLITGVFYGYFYSVFGRETAGGHLRLHRILESPYIDYLSGPGTYYPQAVEMGDPYRARSLIHSVHLHGKLWLDEMDQQPPLVAWKDSLYGRSLQKSIAQVRRNQLFTFTRGHGLWFYDFGPSGFNGGKRLLDHGSFGWWDEPQLLSDIQSLHALLSKYYQRPYRSEADVLLVHDTKTFFYTGSDRTASYMGHWVNNWIPPAIFQTGVVHDVIDIADLPLVRAEQYKVIVFINTWVMRPEQRKYIQQQLAGRGRHLVFIYAPGFSDGYGFDTKWMDTLTRMKIREVKSAGSSQLNWTKASGLTGSISVWDRQVEPLFGAETAGTEALAHHQNSELSGIAFRQDKAFATWFLALAPTDLRFWRSLFERAGAHLYANEKDVIYAGHGLLSIHTASGGRRTIKLRNGKTIDIELPPATTTVFDAETGVVLLK